MNTAPASTIAGDSRETGAPADGGSEQAPVVRSAGITLIGSAIGGALVIVNEVLAARLLQSQSYGLYASGMTVARIGEALAVFGIPVGIFHFLPGYRRTSQRDLIAGTIYAAALLPLVAGMVFALAAWFAAPTVSLLVFKNERVTTYIRLLAIAVPFMALSEVLGAVTRGFGYAKYYVVVKNLIPPIIFFTAIVAMMWFIPNPLWITAAVTTASLIACAAGCVVVARIGGSDLWRVKPRFPFASLYKYSAGIMLNTFFYMVFALTGILAVGVFLGSESVGIYRVCLQVVVPFDMVLLAFHAAMGPVYPVLSRENRMAELEHAYGTAVRWMALLLLPIGIILAWNRNDLLALVGTDFTSGSTALAILAVGYASCTCFGTVAYLLMLSGRKSIETRNAAFAALLNATLAIALVPRLGLTGAAIATALSFVLLNILRLWQAHYIVGLRTFRPHFVRIILVSVGTGVSIFGTLQWLRILQGRDAVSIALRIIVMSVIHVVVIWTLALNDEDRATFRRLLPSWRTGEQFG